MGAATVGTQMKIGDLKPAERIIEAASRLFCRDGIHATGIDSILAEAGTAKMTLYNQFGSKEALVEAVLRREGEVWRSWLRAALWDAGASPRERLGALFGVLRQWFERQDYFGCALMNAVAEYPKNDPRIRAVTLDHKAAVGSILRELVEQAGCCRSDDLMNELTILIDGAIIAALIGRDPSAADAAGRIFKLVLAAHLPA
jgi:AcrR family transcriptional regulator